MHLDKILTPTFFECLKAYIERNTDSNSIDIFKLTNSEYDIRYIIADEYQKTLGSKPTEEQLDQLIGKIPDSIAAEVFKQEVMEISIDINHRKAAALEESSSLKAEFAERWRLTSLTPEQQYRRLQAHVALKGMAERQRQSKNTFAETLRRELVDATELPRVVAIDRFGTVFEIPRSRWGGVVEDSVWIEGRSTAGELDLRALPSAEALRLFIQPRTNATQLRTGGGDRREAVGILSAMRAAWAKRPGTKESLWLLFKERGFKKTSFEQAWADARSTNDNWAAGRPKHSDEHKRTDAEILRFIDSYREREKINRK